MLKFEKTEPDEQAVLRDLDERLQALIDQEVDPEYASLDEFCRAHNFPDRETFWRQFDEKLQSLIDADATVNEIRKHCGFPPHPGCDVPWSQNPLHSSSSITIDPMAVSAKPTPSANSSACSSVQPSA